MKVKHTKFLLCGILVLFLVMRNLQDGQFVMSLFFSVVCWQCLRSAFEVKGLEEQKNRQELRLQAEQAMCGPLAGKFWCLPYLALALCGLAGILAPGLRMPGAWLFLGILVLHTLYDFMIWKRAARLARGE